MATKLWSKGYTIHPEIEAYGAASNAALDAALARYDVLGSLAHARMLCQVGLLTEAEWRPLHTALCELLALAEQGQLQPTTGDEDIHTLIEQALVARVGAQGKQIHTGRSRNDQVLLDLRLYARDALHTCAQSLLATAGALLDLARAQQWTPMPGYTHMQRAMLSSVGLWAAAHAEALLDDAAHLAAVYALNDASPLGSAAAYGVPLPLDRAYVARLLGFAGIHHNVLAAANARGKVESAIVGALSLVLLDLSKWAQDVLLFTTAEYQFFTVPQELCAGSSIMPQKRNLEALELVRARAQTVAALHHQMLATLIGLPSGYNMDYQETKAPLLDAVRICRESLGVARLVAEGLEAQPERLRAACTGEIFAADRAYELAADGIPFRDAYRRVAEAPQAATPDDLEARLRLRTAEGAPGNLQLGQVAARLEAERAAWQRRHEHVARALAHLRAGAPSPAVPAAPTRDLFADHSIALGI